MNRNQYDQDERMHRGIGRERELEEARREKAARDIDAHKREDD